MLDRLKVCYAGVIDGSELVALLEHAPEHE
jgi:hypothetical protein